MWQGSHTLSHLFSSSLITHHHNVISCQKSGSVVTNPNRSFTNKIMHQQKRAFLLKYPFVTVTQRMGNPIRKGNSIIGIAVDSIAWLCIFTHVFLALFVGTVIIRNCVLNCTAENDLPSNLGDSKFKACWFRKPPWRAETDLIRTALLCSCLYQLGH